MSEWKDLTEYDWWEGLSAEDKTWVRKDSEGMDRERHIMGNSRLRCGMHLTDLKARLEPLGVYRKYIWQRWRLDFGTERNWRMLYEEARANAAIPQKVLDVAISHGVDKLTPQMVEGLSEESTPQEVMTRITTVLEMPRPKPAAVHVIEQDERTLVREALNLAYARMRRIPEEHRIKHFKDLTAMLAFLCGVTEPFRVKPEQTPVGYRLRGRPAKTA